MSSTMQGDPWVQKGAKQLTLPGEEKRRHNWFSESPEFVFRN